LRYVTARYKTQQRELAYRIYVTDALKIIGGLNARYYEFIDDKPQDNRTAEEVVEGIRNKLTALGGE
jgi:hypothetical protein